MELSLFLLYCTCFLPTAVCWQVYKWPWLFLLGKNFWGGPLHSQVIVGDEPPCSLSLSRKGGCHTTHTSFWNSKRGQRKAVSFSVPFVAFRLRSLNKVFLMFSQLQTKQAIRFPSPPRPPPPPPQPPLLSCGPPLLAGGPPRFSRGRRKVLLHRLQRVPAISLKDGASARKAWGQKKLCYIIVIKQRSGEKLGLFRVQKNFPKCPVIITPFPKI